MRKLVRAPRLHWRISSHPSCSRSGMTASWHLSVTNGLICSRDTYPIFQAIDQPLTLGIPSQAWDRIFCVGAGVGALPTRLRHPACFRHRVVANCPYQDPIVRRHGYARPIRAQREVVNREGRRHSDGEFRLVFGAANVPDKNRTIFSPRDQQSLVVGRFRLQRLPLEAGNTAVMSRDRAPLAKLVPNLHARQVSKPRAS